MMGTQQKPHMNERFFRSYLLFACFVFLVGCASSGQSGFNAAEPKNSIPFFDRESVEEARVIAVPPFLGDIDRWREEAAEKLSASKAAIVPAAKVDQALRALRKDLANADVEERPEILNRIGRAVQADAVVNGIVFAKDGKNELIIQLIATKDSRLLWWQAIDFSLTAGKAEKADQDALLTRMLSPLVLHAGKKARPAPQGALPKSDADGRQDRKAKPAKKPDKSAPQDDNSENISPM